MTNYHEPQDELFEKMIHEKSHCEVGRARRDYSRSISIIFSDNRVCHCVHHWQINSRYTQTMTMMSWVELIFNFPSMHCVHGLMIWRKIDFIKSRWKFILSFNSIPFMKTWKRVQFSILKTKKDFSLLICFVDSLEKFCRKSFKSFNHERMKDKISQ